MMKNEREIFFLLKCGKEHLICMLFFDLLQFKIIANKIHSLSWLNVKKIMPTIEVE